jgi:hypothetical protein
MGSLAYGLPTEAVYRRGYRHMYVRGNYERTNEELLGGFSFRNYDQIMVFADQ